MDTILNKEPRETNGRSTVARFGMQFQAAAYAALEILSGKEVDRIYCDYHDDFVVRRKINGVAEYHFFQVKTKGQLNQQWKVSEIFSINKKGALDKEEKLEAIRNSMAGKLFVHIIAFEKQCREVTVLSNVHFDEEVHNLIKDLHAGHSSKKYISQFIEKFAEIISPSKSMTEDEVEAARRKMTLKGNVSYIGETLENFRNEARNEIWKHSEIDLRMHEVDEIASSLIALISKKSSVPISRLSKADIDNATGVGLEDLLKVLSISTQVYQNLVSGGDKRAIKVASILQRKLKESGASESMIEYASQAKVKWDVWVRSARHTFPDFAFNVLLDEIDKKCKAWLLSGGALVDLEPLVNDILRSNTVKKFSTLNGELLFGAFCASIVRRATQ